MFYELCIYEVNPNMQGEFEVLISEVAAFYRAQSGVHMVKYIKRTHKESAENSFDMDAVPLRLTREKGKVTYALYWMLESAEAHARIARQANRRYGESFSDLLTASPKTILGEELA